MPKVSNKGSSVRTDAAPAPYGKGNSSGIRLKCGYPECTQTYINSTDLSRHKWTHLPSNVLPLCPYEGAYGYQCDHRYLGRTDVMRLHWQRDHSHRKPWPEHHQFPSLRQVCKENNITLENGVPVVVDSSLAATTKAPAPPKKNLHDTILDKMRPHFHWSLAEGKEPQPERPTKITPMTLQSCGWNDSIQIPSTVPSRPTFSADSTVFQFPTSNPQPQSKPEDYYNSEPFFAPQGDVFDFDTLFNQPYLPPTDLITDEDWATLAAVAEAIARQS